MGLFLLLFLLLETVFLNFAFIINISFQVAGKRSFR